MVLTPNPAGLISLSVMSHKAQPTGPISIDKPYMLLPTNPQLTLRLMPNLVGEKKVEIRPLEPALQPEKNRAPNLVDKAQHYASKVPQFNPESK